MARAHARGAPYGLKLPWQTRSELLDKLPRPTVLIHYYRRDLVGQAISHVRAMQTKQWIQPEGAPAAPTDGLRYRYRAILGACQWIRRDHRSIVQYGADWHVAYEDVCACPEIVVQRLGELLGIEVKKKPATNMLIQRDELSAAWREQFGADLRRHGDCNPRTR
jgi:LPS sulfotransferase NodH